MNFRNILKKLKPKLMLLALTMLLAIPAALQNPITAYADANGTYIDTDGNLIVQGGGGGSIATYTVPGPSLTGWLVYVVDVSGAQQSSADWARGNIVSDIVYVHAGRTLPTAIVDNLYTRMGNFDRPVAFYTDCPWGAPFDTRNLSRQVEIENFMEETFEYNGRTVANSFAVVYRYLGEDVARLYLEHPDTTYLILEACASHTILAGSKEGLNQIASGYGWALTQRLTSIGRKDAGLSYFTEYGVAVGTSFGGNHADTSWCDNRELIKTCVLNERWEGIPYPVDETTLVTDRCGRVSNVTVSNTGPYDDTGFGMLAYRLDNPAINTYNNQDSPGPAEDPITTNKSGLCTIVKGYITETQTYTKDATTGNMAPDGDPITTSDGIFITQNTTNIINVMAEPEYSIEYWCTSSTLDTTLDPLNWNPPNTIHTGSVATQRVLNTHNGEKVVYILLKKTATNIVEVDNPDDVPPTVTISESRLTKRTWLSEFGGIDWYNYRDTSINQIYAEGDIFFFNTNALDLEFVWTLYPHLTDSTCPGHFWRHTSNTGCLTGSWGTCNCNICSSSCTTDHNGDGHDSSCDTSVCPSTCTTDHNGTALGMGHDTSVCTTNHNGEGHQTSHDSWCASHTWNCPGYTTYCTWDPGTWDDNSLNLGVYYTIRESGYTLSHVDKTDFYFKTVNNTETTPKIMHDFTRRDAGPTASYLTVTDKNMVYSAGRLADDLTIANWINNGDGIPNSTTAISDLTNVNVIGNWDMQNKSNFNRVDNDYSTAVAVLVQESYDSTRDVKTIYKPSLGTPGGTCEATTRNGKLFNEDTQRRLLTEPLTVFFEVFKGSGGSTSLYEAPTEPKTLQYSGTLCNGVRVNTNQVITFTPYIRMQYDKISSTNNIAYIMGEFNRMIQPADYAEIHWAQTSTPNLILSSTQWSTHATAVQNWGVDSVLPGGATMTLTIPSSNRQVVTERCYFFAFLFKADTSNSLFKSFQY